MTISDWLAAVSGGCEAGGDTDMDDAHHVTCYKMLFLGCLFHVSSLFRELREQRLLTVSARLARFSPPSCETSQPRSAASEAGRRTPLAGPPRVPGEERINLV